MDFHSEPFAVPVVLIGVVVVVGLLLQAGLRRTAVPTVVVYLGLGFALAVADWRTGWVGDSGRDAIEFLGSVGLIFLLFRVGLESNVAKLLGLLRGSLIVWIADIGVSASLGFVASRYVLGLELLPCLFVAVAMSATSVGVGVAVWREERALDATRGQLLLDVAELDDISGIVLMAVLFAVAPVLQDGRVGELLPTVAWTAGEVLARLALFGLAVAAFAHFVEAPLTRLVTRLELPPDRLLTVISIGMILAAAAGALGFSFAIGAFFAGLAFSRDPEAVKLDTYFDPLYDFFAPFFFIAIGMRVDPGSLSTSLPLGLLLFGVAAAGKLMGAGGGSLAELPPRDAALVGLGMIPRAEIALVIMQHGMLLGAGAVSGELFSAMVLVSILTCLFSSIATRVVLRREAASVPTRGV
jgi:Kef-type K+ transport system membrane component KefB